jgi:hypothetical protein
MGKGWDQSKIGPRPTVPATPYEDLRDPANGEPVPRCRTCGVPGGNLYALFLHNRAAGTYRICDHCWRDANPPDRQATDPLRAA